MSNSKLTMATPDEVEAVYYEAFKHCDLSVMSAVWGRDGVYCVHPGSGLISGREAVIRSWSAIFDGSQFAELAFDVLERVISNDLAIHVVAETIGSGDTMAVVLATNTYHRFEQGWLMIGHHASLVHTGQQKRSLQ